MNILFLTSRYPYPPHGGDRLRAFHFIRHLARNHHLTVLALTEKPPEAAAVAAVHEVTPHVESIVLPGWRSRFQALAALPSRSPLQVAYYRCPGMNRRLRQLAASQQFDLVFAHLARMAPFALQFPAAARVLDLTDALSLAYARGRGGLRRRLALKCAAERLEAQRILLFELEMIRRFTLSLLVSPVDRDYLARYIPPTRLRIVPPGVDTAYFRNRIVDRARPHEIIFLGKLSTVANLDAVEFFVKDIFPRVRLVFPEAVLRVIGIEAPRRLRALHQPGAIEILGEVADVRPYLQRAALSVCPMRLGAGVKNKVLESLAAGTPVVATSIGAAGLELEDGEHFLLADSAEAFAAAVLRILREAPLQRRLIDKGRRLVAARYAWPRALAALDSIIKEAVTPPDRSVPALVQHLES